MTVHEDRLSTMRVHEAMHTGILTTDSDTPLRVVARLMASQQVHAVAVVDPEHARRPWGVVTALDVVKAAAQDADLTAAESVSEELLTIPDSESLSWAAQLMADHGICHIVVVDAATGHPCGILSSLDIAAAYGA